MARDGLKADAILVVATLVWGATFSVVKGALPFVDPVTFLVARFSLAAMLLLPFVGRQLWRRDVLRAGLILGSVISVTFLTQTVGLLYTTPSRSAFITGRRGVGTARVAGRRVGLGGGADLGTGRVLEADRVYAEVSKAHPLGTLIPRCLL